MTMERGPRVKLEAEPGRENVRLGLGFIYFLFWRKKYFIGHFIGQKKRNFIGHL